MKIRKKNMMMLTEKNYLRSTANKVLSEGLDGDLV